MSSDSYEKKYLKYKYKYLSLKNMMKQQGGGKDKVELILIKADWCGFCKRFTPVWNTLQEQYKNKFKFTTYDGDKDRTLVEKFNVKGFPTILYKKNNKFEPYEGPREMEYMIEFLDSLDQ